MARPWPSHRSVDDSRVGDKSEELCDDARVRSIRCTLLTQPLLPSGRRGARGASALSPELINFLAASEGSRSRPQDLSGRPAPMRRRKFRRQAPWRRPGEPCSGPHRTRDECALRECRPCPRSNRSTTLSGPTADDRIGTRLGRDTPTRLDRDLTANPRLVLHHVGCRHRVEHGSNIGRRDRRGPIVLEIVECSLRANNARFDIGETRPCP